MRGTKGSGYNRKADHPVSPEVREFCRLVARILARLGPTATEPATPDELPAERQEKTDMRKNDMEIMLRLRCTGCGKCFIVEDDQVETDYLSCPHCQDEIEVSEPDDEG